MEPDLLGPISEIIKGFLEFFKAPIEWINSKYYSLLRGAAEFLAPLATIAAGAFAIRQKWRFAERNMHRRLQEFLQREDKRLKNAETNVYAAMHRSDPGDEFGKPIFQEKRLTPVLKRMRWGSISLDRPHIKKIDRAQTELDAAVEELKEQLKVWESQRSGFERKKFQAHLLRGAIESTRAAKAKAAGQEDREANLKALSEFESALELFPDDLQCLEYVAHQRSRLMDYEAAIEDLEKIATLAKLQNNCLLAAKAKRHQGEIREAQFDSTGTQRYIDDARSRLQVAADLIPANYQCTLDAGEIHEVRARIQAKRGYLPSALNYLTDAEQSYVNLTTAEAKLARTRAQNLRQQITAKMAVNDGKDGVVPSPDAQLSATSSQLN